MSQPEYLSIFFNGEGHLFDGVLKYGEVPDWLEDEGYPYHIWVVDVNSEESIMKMYEDGHRREEFDDAGFSFENLAPYCFLEVLMAVDFPEGEPSYPAPDEYLYDYGSIEEVRQKIVNAREKFKRVMEVIRSRDSNRTFLKLSL